MTNSANAHNQPPDELLTVKELSAITRMHEQTLWRLIRRDKLPGVVRFGRSIRVKRSIVLAWHAMR